MSSLWMRALVALGVLVLGAASQLSCSVNDYCLNCDNGDGDGGMGSGDANDGGGSGGDAIDAGCIPTGPEECDGEDNDCNGLVDDGNQPGVGVLCANQNGVCAGGLTVCQNGSIKCDKMGSPETCNGLDDNCSGAPDEGDPGGGAKCGTDLGECVAGQFHCDATTGTVECFGFIDHRMDPELCDAKDNDCDGNFDENVVITPSACGPTTDVGLCVIGSLSCQGGAQICMGAVFPKFEICNNLDDDCDGMDDEIFNKATDIQNCVNCGVVCQPKSKTCINSPTMGVNGTTCTMDSQCSGGTCAVNSQPRCMNGCTFACNAGFQNLDGNAANGCEYRCFATGAEECDGADNDCDGNTDEGLTPPPLCLAGGECGTTAPAAQCTGPGGWTCTYPGVTQFPETLCDGKNNDCDANIDENQPKLTQACSEVPETICTAAVDNDNDGFINDGCPASGPAETGADCADAVDDDGDTLVNDGCPAREERGVCKSSGTYTCDPMNLNGPAKCTITMPGQNPDPGETCDFKDNDCDGQTDEGGATGDLAGQEWVDIGGGLQMMKYEASKPDATATDQGTRGTSDTNAFTCSRQGVLPWTNIKYPDAVAACAKIGATLCSEVQWHRGCSVITSPTFPLAVPGTPGTFIEAENYETTAYAGAAETVCTGAVDNDLDGRVNDGCPSSGAPETNCTNATDDDGDTLVNDGCVALGPHAWVEDYTTGFSGIGALEATPNLGATIDITTATTQAPRLDYTINFTSGASYVVWVKMFANSNVNDRVYVSLDSAAPTTGTATTFGSWHWVNAGALSGTVSGQHTLHVYMGEDGVKIDKIYIINGATTAGAIGTAETINGKGGKWAFATNPNNYQMGTCNGDDYDTSAQNGDQDDILATGALASCKAAWGTQATDGIFDMSGNVKEWTLAHVPGENPVRGGASNNTPEGISCPLNFTLADDEFFFPNIGFRCCR